MATHTPLHPPGADADFGRRPSAGASDLKATAASLGRVRLPAAHRLRGIVLAHLASLGGVAPEMAICMATGNTARVYGLPVGQIAAGREADCCLVDAPVGSVGRTALEALRAGDLFGISMALIDGQIRIGRSRNTPPAARAAEVIKGQGPAGGAH